MRYKIHPREVLIRNGLNHSITKTNGDVGAACPELRDKFSERLRKPAMRQLHILAATHEFLALKPAGLG